MAPKKSIVVLSAAVAVAGAYWWRRHREVDEGARDVAAPPPATTPDAVAAGASTLTDVLTRAESAGYGGEFVAEVAGTLRCPACGASTGAGDMRRHWQERLEGASDPADSLVVSGLECPSCHAHATYVAPYGAAASAEQAEVATHLPEPDGELPVTARTRDEAG